MLLDFATNPWHDLRLLRLLRPPLRRNHLHTQGGARRGRGQLVADSYASITISDATYRDLAAKVDATTHGGGRDQGNS